MVAKFHDADDPGAHGKFERWLRENRHKGFFVNFVNADQAMLHHARCPYISNWSQDQDGSLTRNEKLCSLDEEELRCEVQRRLHKPLTVCSECF